MKRFVLAVVLLLGVIAYADGYFVSKALTKRSPDDIQQLRLPKKFKPLEMTFDGDYKTVHIRMENGKTYTFVLRDVEDSVLP